MDLRIREVAADRKSRAAVGHLQITVAVELRQPDQFEFELRPANRALGSRVFILGPAAQDPRRCGTLSGV